VQGQLNLGRAAGEEDFSNILKLVFVHSVGSFYLSYSNYNNFQAILLIESGMNSF